MITILYIVALNIAILVMTYFLVKQHNAIVELENEIAYYKTIISGLRNEITVYKAMNKN